MIETVVCYTNRIIFVFISSHILNIMFDCDWFIHEVLSETLRADHYDDQ